MAGNLDPKTLYDFITGDFEDAWNAIAGVAGSAVHRGNFMFGRQAMILLEWAARLSASDASGNALGALTAELEKIDPHYFTPLPGVCMKPGREFQVPASPTRGPAEQQLLAAVFDLIRNGQAHQYQQIVVALSDGKEFIVALTGAEHTLSLKNSLAGGRPKQHLAFKVVSAQGVGLDVRTDVLFLDLKQAITNANLLARGLSFKHLERPDPQRAAGHYNFDSRALEAALEAGGHHRL